MDQIVFFWVGNSIEIPSYLVKTARLIYKNEVKVIQLSDHSTEKIQEIDKINIIKITNNMMVDRVNAYSTVKTKNNRTLFLDADSLCLNKINFNEYKKAIYLTKRKTNFLINYNNPEHYPEFINKRFCDVMPYLFGSILIINKENFFNKLLSILKKLPDRFHRWYGDQYALKIIYDQDDIKFNFINREFLYIVELDGVTKKINLELNEDIKILTFKGPTKKYIKTIFKKLTKIEPND